MCFLTLHVFACVIHYLWLGREIAQCNCSESTYCIILVYFSCVYHFHYYIISESYEKYGKIIRKNRDRKSCEILHIYVSKKNRKEKEREKLEVCLTYLCIVLY